MITILSIFVIVASMISGCSSSSGLSRSEVRQSIIDSTFTFYEKSGLISKQRVKYIYRFSDRDRIPVQELSKRLVKEAIETIDIEYVDKRWSLRVLENTIHSRATMAEREKSFRWMMFEYKVDNYHGFVMAPADIELAGIASDQFLPFLKSQADDDLFLIGLSLEKIKDHQRAMFVFDELIQREHKLDTSYFKMGNALVGTHEYVKGIQHWEKAVELNPDYLNAHLELGRIFFENSHWKKANHHYVESERIKTNDDGILYNVAKSLIKLERYNEAYTTISRAIKINPKNAHAKGVLRYLKTPGIRKLRHKYPDK